MPSLDLGPVLDIAALVVADALATAGTVVTQTRPQPVTTVNPDTAQATTPSAATIAAGLPALLVPDAQGGQDRVYPGAPVAEINRNVLILEPGVTDVRRGDVFTITASRDPRITGRSYEVSSIDGGSAGAVRKVVVHPVPVDGQA